MKKQIISASLVALGFLAGASALSALASGTWAGPTQAPPNGNVDAPINVGGHDGADSTKWYSQLKTGILGLNDAVIKNLTVTAGASSTHNSVLANINGDGIATWVSTSSLGISGGGNGNTTYGGYTHLSVFTTSGSIIIPAGVSHVKVRAWGGGGGGRVVLGTKLSSSNGAFQHGGGGGGGAYVESNLSILPGTYSVTVGSGGSGHIDLSTPSTDGGDSIFQSVTAGGGKTSSTDYTNANSSGTFGGEGGTGVGDLVINGEKGEDSFFNSSGVAIFGNGGGSPMGGAGGIAPVSVMFMEQPHKSHGLRPGGGGAGSIWDDYNSGGGSGMVIIEY